MSTMTAVVSYVYSTGGAGDLEYLQWDVATLDGTVLFSNQLGPCGFDHERARSGYRGGAYLALVTWDPTEQYTIDRLLKLDAAAGTAETLLTFQQGSVSGVACSLDGQKVFVFVNEGAGAKLLVSSDGGGTWVERSYEGPDTGLVAWLMYDGAIGRLFACGTSDGGWFAGYTDDEGVSWGTDFPDVAPISQWFSYWDPTTPYGLLLEGVIPVSGPGLGPDVVGLMDTQSLSASSFATGEYAAWMRGFWDLNTYDDYHPFSGGPSISLPWPWTWAPSYVSTNQASVEVGENQERILFENPDQTLCSAVAAESFFLGGVKYLFVSEIGEVPFVPFWRNLVGTREIP